MEISILLQNRKTRKEAWLELPLCYDEDFTEEFDQWLKAELGCTGNYSEEQEKQLKAELENDGNYLGEYRIIDHNSDIDIFPEFRNSCDIEYLNRLAERIENEVKPADENLLKALYEDNMSGLAYAIDMTNSGYYYLIPDVENEEEYGRYEVEAGLLEVPEHLQDYIDYSAIGHERRKAGYIAFTDYGCLVGNA